MTAQRFAESVVEDAALAWLEALGWRDRAKVLRDMWRFILLYKEFNWGRQIFRAAMQRPLIGGYSMQRWL